MSSCDMPSQCRRALTGDRVVSIDADKLMLTESHQSNTDGAESGVHCPLCEYDLRGLTEPRCPECGYRFTWDELNDPALRLHPYAFEHHPERNVSSFRQTLLGGLRPGRFWRTLFPTQPSRPQRLVLYWIIVAMTMFAPLALQYARQAARYSGRRTLPARECCP